MGRITIKTALDNTGFENGYNKALAATKRFVSSAISTISTVGKSFDGTTAAIMKQQNVVDELKRKYDALASGEVAPKELTTVEAQLKKAQTETDKLSTEFEKLAQAKAAIETKAIVVEGKPFLSDADTAKIADINAKMDQLSPKWQQAESSAAAYQARIEQIRANPINTNEVKRIADNIAVGNQKLSEMKSKGDQVGSAFSGLASKVNSVASSVVSNLGNAFSNVAGRVREIASSIGSRIGSALQSAGKRATSFFKNFNKGSSQATSGIGKMFTRIKSLLVAAFVFNVIRKGLRELREYIGLALNANQEFASSFAQVKGNIAAAFQPILQSIIPILVTLMQWLAAATASILQFMAALTGKSVKSLQAAAKGMDKLKKSTTGAANAAKGAIASFDELNELQSAGAGGGAANVAGAEYAEIDESDMAWVDVLKAKLLDLKTDWDYFWNLGDSLAVKVAEWLKGIPWDDIQATAKAIAEKLAAFLGGFLTNKEMWAQIGHTIAQGLNTALIFLYTFLTEFPWQMFGEATAAGLNRFFEETDWELLGATMAAWVMSYYDYLYGLFKDLDWKKIGESIGTSVNKFFEDVDWEKVGETISTGIIGALSAIGEGIKKIDWKKMGEDIKTFLVNIDWGGIVTALFTAIGSALAGLALFLWGLLEEAWSSVMAWWQDVAYKDGEFTIEGLLRGIGMAMYHIGEWLYDNVLMPFVNGFKNVFGIASPSKVMAELGKFIMDGLFNGISAMVDTVVELFSGLWDKIKGVWTGVSDWFTKNVTDPLSKGFKTFVNGIIGFFEGMANGVISIFEKLINLIVSGINKLSFKLPDIPGLPGGGSTIGFNIAPVSLGKVSIPRLATGTVLPGGAPYMAWVNDQPKGQTNVEAPMETIKQGVREVLSESGGGSDAALLNTVIGLLERIAAKDGNVVFSRSAEAGRVLSQCLLDYSASTGRG